jgi:hypothetical protein
MSQARFVATSKRLRVESAGSVARSFDVVLTRDDEFGTWDASASAYGSGDSEVAALADLRAQLQQILAALGEASE